MIDLIDRKMAVNALWAERQKMDAFMEECLRNGNMTLRAGTKAERNRIEEDINIIKQLPTIEEKTEHKIHISDKDHIWVDSNQYISLRRFAEAVDEAKSLPADIIRCRDCKHFERDHLSNVNGFPIITCHNICTKWGGGCATREDGFCFLGERKEGKEHEDN